MGYLACQDTFICKYQEIHFILPLTTQGIYWIRWLRVLKLGMLQAWLIRLQFTLIFLIFPFTVYSSIFRLIIDNEKQVQKFLDQWLIELLWTSYSCGRKRTIVISCHLCIPAERASPFSARKQNFQASLWLTQLFAHQQWSGEECHVLINQRILKPVTTLRRVGLNRLAY